MNWPKQNVRELTEFYGEIGTRQVLLTLPYTMYLSWEPAKAINKISCHQRVKEPLAHIFEEVLKYYGLDEIQKLNLDVFSGCFNVRPMRGSKKPSTHSWGIAVDIDDTNNQLKWGRDRATLAKDECQPFWNIVESTGATSLGRTLNYDWMHFQFARI